MSKTYHEESDAGAVWSAIYHNPELQRLISEGNCWDLESLTRLILGYAEEDPNGWRDWTDEVQGALLSYMYNAREDD